MTIENYQDLREFRLKGTIIHKGSTYSTYGDFISQTPFSDSYKYGDSPRNGLRVNILAAGNHSKAYEKSRVLVVEDENGQVFLIGNEGVSVDFIDILDALNSSATHVFPELKMSKTSDELEEWVHSEFTEGAYEEKPKNISRIDLITYSFKDVSTKSAKEMTAVYLKEVMQNIYKVEKDRSHSLLAFIDAKDLVLILNTFDKVAIEQADGLIHSTFELPESTRKSKWELIDNHTGQIVTSGHSLSLFHLTPKHEDEIGRSPF